MIRKHVMTAFEAEREDVLDRLEKSFEGPLLVEWQKWARSEDLTAEAGRRAAESAAAERRDTPYFPSSPEHSISLAAEKLARAVHVAADGSNGGQSQALRLIREANEHTAEVPIRVNLDRL